MVLERKKQFVAYDGDTGPDLPEGDYLAVDTTGHDVTNNSSCWQLWDLFSQEAQKLSADASFGQGMNVQNQIAATLGAINRSFTHVHRRIYTRAASFFDSAFGGPLTYKYMPYPIRWVAESRMGLQIILKFVESLYQIPRVRSNGLDRGLVENHALLILKPVFSLKAEIMRELFGIECRGDISPDELDAVFRATDMMPPLNISLTDNVDSTETLADEDARALSDESAAVPTAEVLEQMLTGQEVWKWAPEAKNWATFAEITRRLESDGPTYVPGEPFPFTTEGPISGASKAKSIKSSKTESP